MTLPCAQQPEGSGVGPVRTIKPSPLSQLHPRRRGHPVQFVTTNSGHDPACSDGQGRDSPQDFAVQCQRPSRVCVVGRPEGLSWSLLEMVMHWDHMTSMMAVSVSDESDKCGDRQLQIFLLTVITLTPNDPFQFSSTEKKEELSCPSRHHS